MALETKCILRPNLGTSADVPDVPSRTSMPQGDIVVVVVYDNNIDDDNDDDGDGGRLP